jgi:hypothetical protein
VAAQSIPTAVEQYSAVDRIPGKNPLHTDMQAPVMEPSAESEGLHSTILFFSNFL